MLCYPASISLSLLHFHHHLCITHADVIFHSDQHAIVSVSYMYREEDYPSPDLAG